MKPQISFSSYFKETNFKDAPLKTISRLDLEQFPWPWDEKTWLMMLTSKRDVCLFTIEDDNVVIGFAIFELLKEDKLAHLYKILVNETYRGDGTANKFHKLCVESLLTLSVKNIYLEVNVSNDRAIAFYRRCDYKILTIKKKFYHNGNDALIMQCFIAE